MIVKIEKEFEDEILNTDLPDADFSKLEEILEQMKNNKIFLLASNNFYHGLKDKYGKKLSFSICKMLDFLWKNTTMLSEAKKIKPLLVIISSDKQPYQDDKSFYLHLRDIPENLVPFIATENIDDANFYEKWFHYVTKYKEKVFIGKESFGGGACVSCIENWSSANRLFFVVSDSDIKYPDDDYGDTAANIIEEYKDNKIRFSEYWILTVHEKENLIPFEFYKEHDDEIKEIVNFINNNKDIKIYYKYYDIKEGVSEKDIKNREKKPKKWKDIYNPVIDYLETKLHQKKGKRKLKEINGIGDKEVTNLIKNDCFFEKLKNKLIEVQMENFETINKLFIKYGFCFYEKYY